MTDDNIVQPDIEQTECDERMSRLADKISAAIEQEVGMTECPIDIVLGALGMISSVALADIEDRQERIFQATDFAMQLIRIAAIERDDGEALH